MQLPFFNIYLAGYFLGLLDNATLKIMQKVLVGNFEYKAN